MSLFFCLGVGFELGFSVFSVVMSICLPDFQTLNDKIYIAATVFLTRIILEFLFVLIKLREIKSERV